MIWSKMSVRLQLLLVVVCIASHFVDEIASHFVDEIASRFVDEIASHFVDETSAKAASCNCAGTTNGGPSASQYICADSRLGPAILPTQLPLGTFVSNYDRFGDSPTPGDFLKKWTVNGSYVYPEQNGFQLNTDGSPILGNMVIQKGTLVDRFGSEYGSYISAADAPYSQRALPPSSLDTNPSSPDYPFSYHIYRVIKPLTVLGGPIAPWFGQPGLGTQFYTGGAGNVMTLIANGYLSRVNTTALIAGESDRGCG